MRDFYTYKDIAELSGLKTDTIYRYLKQDTLPKPFFYIDNKPIWKKTEINEWIENRKEGITHDTTD